MLALFAAAAAEQDAVFKLPVLNEGLAPPGDEIDLTTPQTAMETFLFATEDADYATAAHVLNLNDIDVVAQPTQGAALARQLAVVLDRKVLLSWQQLLERPDALLANASSNNPMAETARKSLLIGVLDLDNRGVAIRLNRVQPQGGDALWVFSRQTVSRIAALYARYGPSAFERALPAALRTDAFAGPKWWEVIGLPALFALAFGVHVMLWRLLGTLPKAVKSSRASGVLKALRVPMTIALVSALVKV